MNNLSTSKVIFVHSLFRAGSTYFYYALKRTGKFHVYHEPFHEVIANLSTSLNELIDRTDELKKHLRHGFLNGTYFDEYLHLLPFIKKEFCDNISFELFFLDRTSSVETLKSYIDCLINGSKNMPVLQCTRSIGRVKWLKENYPSLNIFLLRNPWDQWYSYKVDSYIASTYQLVYAQPRLPKVFCEIMSACGYQSVQGATVYEQMDYCRQHPVTPDVDYWLFFGLWLFAFVVGHEECEIVLDMDSISLGSMEQDKAKGRLERFGIQDIALHDCSLHRAKFKLQEKNFYQSIERQVIEIFKSTGFSKNLLEMVEDYLTREESNAFVDAVSADKLLVNALEDASRLRLNLMRVGQESTSLVNTLNQAVIERDEQIAGLNAAVVERDEQIAELNAAVVERDEQLSRLNESISKLENEVMWLNCLLRRIKAPWQFGRRIVSSMRHPAAAYRLMRDVRVIQGSGLFDISYYLSTYRDVCISLCDPIRHYCEFGWKEGRNPSSQFDTEYYLNANPDVAAAEINPYVHYVHHGRSEGRNPVEKCPLINESDEEIPDVRQAVGGRFRILVMDYRVPMPDVSAGERATVGILGDLCAIGFDVVFLPSNMGTASGYEEDLERLGVTVITNRLGFDSSLDYLSKWGHTFATFYLIRVDVVETVLDTIHKVAPQATTFFHAPDIHFLRESRDAEIKNDPALHAKAEAMRQRELAVMNQVDRTVIVSSAELPVVRQFLPDVAISVFPVLYSPVNDSPTHSENREDIFFLGGFGHPPNVDAVGWFVGEIWPLIREQLPKAVFHIVGSEAPQEVLDLASVPGVQVDGFVKELEPLLSRMRVGVAPLRYGAGIKGKVAMTMGAGIPCVCTTIAAEGMGIESGFHAFIADEPRLFADAVVRLCKDRIEWQHFSINGRELVRRRFSEEANRASLLSVLNTANALPLDLFANYCQRLAPRAVPISCEHAEVDVSIIIPVYNQWDYTRACLNSILETCQGDEIRYEILLADDGSTDETTHADEVYPGVCIVKTPRNVGFLRNCNNAAKRAQGKYLLLLNNDTVVLPGWMSALYHLMEQDDRVAIAGSKLLYPDGTIQEAGGLIWNDATGRNCGRSLARSTPGYDYVRQVDYISGASIMVRKSFWDSVGGFDERYENAYCEDSDLAMAARFRGMQVLYQPASEVIHFEHVSYSREEADHPMQIANTSRLRAKWREVLMRDHLPPDSPEFVGMAKAAERPLRGGATAHNIVGSRVPRSRQ